MAENIRGQYHKIFNFQEWRIIVHYVQSQQCNCCLWWIMEYFHPVCMQKNLLLHPFIPAITTRGLIMKRIRIYTIVTCFHINIILRFLCGCDMVFICWWKLEEACISTYCKSITFLKILFVLLLTFNLLLLVK